MKLTLTLAAVLGLSVVAHADDDSKKYTLADLKSLVGQKAYKEAFVHLGDISPSQRNADWLDVGGAAAGGVLGLVPADDGSTIEMIDQIDRDYPQLLKSPKYSKPRAELGYKGLKGCFDQTGGYWGSYGLENCVKIGLRFVDNAPDDRATALKIAKLARRNMTAYYAVPFFKRALGAKDNKAACKDEDMKLAVLAGLGLPPDYDNAKEAKTIASGACWAELKGPMVKALEGETGYLRDNLCELLTSKKALTAAQANICAKKRESE